MNKITFNGRITNKIESKITDSNIKFVRFTVACNNTFNKQADFIPVIAWRNQADFIEKYLNKGSHVLIEGRFSSSTYEKDGKKFTRYEIVLSQIESLETKKQAETRQREELNKQNEVIQFTKEKQENKNKNEVPWEMDL